MSTQHESDAFKEPKIEEVRERYESELTNLADSEKYAASKMKLDEARAAHAAAVQATVSPELADKLKGMKQRLSHLKTRHDRLADKQTRMETAERERIAALQAEEKAATEAREKARESISGGACSCGSQSHPHARRKPR